MPRARENYDAQSAFNRRGYVSMDQLRILGLEPGKNYHFAAKGRLTLSMPLMRASKVLGLLGQLGLRQGERF